jgi:hypothetical protein
MIEPRWCTDHFLVLYCCVALASRLSFRSETLLLAGTDVSQSTNKASQLSFCVGPRGVACICALMYPKLRRPIFLIDFCRSNGSVVLAGVPFEEIVWNESRAIPSNLYFVTQIIPPGLQARQNGWCLSSKASSVTVFGAQTMMTLLLQAEPRRSGTGSGPYRR